MKVIYLGNNEYNVKLESASALNFKAILGEAVVANRFVDLTDVSISGLSASKDNYPVVYDADTGKFVIVDPDTILSAASTSTGPQPGLPGDFVNVMDVDLDNRIDLDAGSF